MDVKIRNNQRCKEGRKLLINCNINGLDLSLINIYAPCSVSDREVFFTETADWIKHNISEDNFTIICGDFNSVMSPNDRTSKKVERCSKQFKKLLISSKTIDVYRTHNQTEPGYTWVDLADPTHRSRIDYLLTTKYLNQYIKTCDNLNAPTPDHKAVFCKIEINKKQRGKGYWKMNTEM